jgi:uncharacterized membrane protein
MWDIHAFKKFKKMTSRPQLQLGLSQSDQAFEIMGWLSLVIMWVYTIIKYSTLPDIIPIHFNGEGQPDDFGSRATIFIFTGIGTLIFVGLTVLNKHPQKFNYLRKITPENSQRQYTNATKMVRFLKFSISLILLLSVYEICQIATGKSQGFGIWFLPFVLGLIFIPVILYGIKSIALK